MKTNRIHSIELNACALFALLLMLYFLTFNGQFGSIDELNLYAMTESLVQNSTIEVPQVNFAAYHNPVRKHEIGFPLAALPLYWHREPLVGFLWILGIYGLISWRMTENKWWGGLGAISILLPPLVKVNVSFSIPFLFLVTQKNLLTQRKHTYANQLRYLTITGYSCTF